VRARRLSIVYPAYGSGVGVDVRVTVAVAVAVGDAVAVAVAVAVGAGLAVNVGRGVDVAGGVRVGGLRNPPPRREQADRASSTIANSSTRQAGKPTGPERPVMCGRFMGTFLGLDQNLDRVAALEEVVGG
jgi:hypothetical protein